MKVFRDGVCYVDYIDLIVCPVPSFLNFDKELYDYNDMVVFKDKKSIEYIRNREDIIDYDMVSSLSVDDIDKLYNSALDNYIQYDKRWFSPEKDKLFYDKKFQKEYGMCKHLVYGYLYYRNHKKEVDEKINKKISNKKVHIGAIGYVDHSKTTLKYAIEQVLKNKSKSEEYPYSVDIKEKSKVLKK